MMMHQKLHQNIKIISESILTITVISIEVLHLGIQVP